MTVTATPTADDLQAELKAAEQAVHAAHVRHDAIIGRAVGLDGELVARVRERWTRRGDLEVAKAAYRLAQDRLAKLSREEAAAAATGV